MSLYFKYTNINSSRLKQVSPDIVYYINIYIKATNFAATDAQIQNDQRFKAHFQGFNV